MTMSQKDKEFVKKRNKRLFKGLYKWGLLISAVLHGTIIGILAMPKGGGEVEGDESSIDGKVKIMQYDELPPPPSIVPQVTMPVGLPGEGSVGEIPMPVPDELAEKETISDIVPGFEDGVPDGDITVDTSGIVSASIEQIEFVAYEQKPVYINRIEPIYPTIGREGGVEGTVGLMVYVGTDGKVKNVFVTQPMDLNAFNEAAVDAAYQCTFTPATMSGVPIGVWLSVPMHFTLH